MAQPYRGRTVVTIVHPSQDLSWRSPTNLSEVVSALHRGINAGATGTYADTRVTVTQGGVQATGTVTYSSASGTTTVTINAVAFSQTTGTDAARAAQAATDINASANALISGILTASSVAGVLTITATAHGKTGNSITMAATGTGATASGSRLTGGTNATGQLLRRP